jgi:YidC/Oxa1 family membrane protein insertase
MIVIGITGTLGAGKGTIVDYYFLANIMTFAQMYLIRKTIDEEKIHQQILMQKTKPVKKSKFQRKLEELSKQQQQIANSRKKR